MSSSILSRTLRSSLSSPLRLRPTTTTTRYFRATPFAMSSTEAPKRTVQEITSKDQFYSLISSEDVVILDASATWCGPCKAIAPQYTKWAEEFPAVTFAKFDVDQVPDVAQELGVTAMPTFFIFKGGDKKESVKGANPPAILKLLAEYKGTPSA